MPRSSAPPQNTFSKADLAKLMQWRTEKKIREARRLADVPPEETLRMGFSLCRFTVRLREAAARARA